MPIPRNIYGVSKLAAENLCELFARRAALPCIILRTSRFFPEEDDAITVRRDFGDANLKVNELLYRRADLADVGSAHLRAMQLPPGIRFGRYIVSATTPFTRDDVVALGKDASAVVRRRIPGYEPEYRRRGWALPPAIDRVYSNEVARTELGWQPHYDFRTALDRIEHGQGISQPSGTDSRLQRLRYPGAIRLNRKTPP